MGASDRQVAGVTANRRVITADKQLQTLPTSSRRQISSKKCPHKEIQSRRQNPFCESGDFQLPSSIMASSSLPPNVNVSQHPCLRAKLSQLRSNSTNAKETKTLVHEIALILGCEALGKGLKVTEGGKVCGWSTQQGPQGKQIR